MSEPLPKRQADDARYEALAAENERLRWELGVARDPVLRRDLHWCEHCQRTSPDPAHTAQGWCPTCGHYCNPGHRPGSGWQR
jgi:hypothetical protein